MNRDCEPIGLDPHPVSDRANILLKQQQCTSGQWGYTRTSVALELRHGKDRIGRLAMLIQLDPRASARIIRTV